MPAVGIALTWKAVFSKIVVPLVLSTFSYVLTMNKRRFQVSQRDALRSTTTSVGPHQIVYGEAIVGGTIVFTHYSGDEDYFNVVVVFAGHEIDSFQAFYLDGLELTLDGSGNSTGPDKFDGLVHVEYKLGTADQTALTALVTEVDNVIVWSSDHRLRGRAYAWFRFKYDPTTFASGLPNITAKVRGKKVFDPRTDTTVWSDNPALCAADWITATSYGLGADYATEIDDDALVAAANVCEESVSLDAGGSEERYRCNGAVWADEKHREVLEKLLASMGGTLTYANGKFVILAGAYRSPTLTFTEDDFRGPIHVRTLLSRNELANTVKGIFINSAKGGVPDEYPAKSNAAYVTADRETLYRDLDLPLVTSHTQAQRLAKIDLERGRRQITVNATVGLRAWQLRVGDTVQVTLSRYGWSSKVFEVVQIGLEARDDGGGSVLEVPIVLREHESGVYSWTAATDEDILGAPSGMDPGDPTSIAPPTGLSLTADDTVARVGKNGIVVPRIKASWTSPTAFNVVAFEVQFKPTADSVYEAFGTVPRRSTATTSAYVIPVQDGVAYDVRVRSVSVVGAYSTWVSDSVTVSVSDQEYDGFVARTARVRRTTGDGPLTHSIETGIAADAAAVTFSTTFDDPPQVVFVPTARVYSSGLTGTQQLRLEAQNLSAAGFTMKARVSEEVGSTTLQTLTFSGDTATKTSPTYDAEAWNDRYRFQYDVVMDTGAISDPLTLGFWTKPSGGVFVLRDTRYYPLASSGTKTYTNELVDVTVDGLGGNAEFKITVEAGGAYTLTRDSVTYYTATPPTDAAATSGEAKVTWIAFAGRS